METTKAGVFTPALTVRHIGIYQLEMRFLIFLKDLKEAKKVTIAIRKYNCSAIGWNAALNALYRWNRVSKSFLSKKPATNIQQNSDSGIIAVSK
ncbi:MAG: hypothetical protein IJO04_03280 [Oscillospiraceae bacterium]|nr:hypothetical protein [Oscillospiraceae bacterium]